MIKTIRIQLLPNNKQKTLLKKSADTARWAYNWALSKQLEESLTSKRSESGSSSSKKVDWESTNFFCKFLT